MVRMSFWHERSNKSNKVAIIIIHNFSGYSLRSKVYSLCSILNSIVYVYILSSIVCILSKKGPQLFYKKKWYGGSEILARASALTRSRRWRFKLRSSFAKQRQNEVATVFIAKMLRIYTVLHRI